jgi:hypothetical protein
MNTVHLYTFGCAVSFIAVAGVYVYLRAWFVGKSQRQARLRNEQEKSSVVLWRG